MPHVFFHDLLHTALCVVMVVGMTSCDDSRKEMQPLKPVSQTNVERTRLGLRIIKPSWFLYRTEFGAEDWKVSPSSRELAKRVQYGTENKTPQWEEDYYYSGRTYTDADGTAWEHAVIHYDYSTETYQLHYLGANATLQALVDPFRIGTTNSAAVMKGADAVLSRLGQPRL